AGGEGAVEHEALHAAVEAGAADGRGEIGSADLQGGVRGVDGEVAGHADKPLAQEDGEGDVLGRAEALTEGAVEMLADPAHRVDVPDVRVLGTGGAERLAMALGERLQPDLAVRHGGAEGHSSSSLGARSCATLGARSSESMWLPSSKLSSARNLSLAAYFVFTRVATVRWR